MSEAEVPAQSPAPRPKRRLLFRFFRGFLVLVVLLIVTYIVADQVMLRKVQQKREAFRERFGKVDFRDFIPERPAPEEDAGRVYGFAIAQMAKADQEYGDWSIYHALTEGAEAFRKRGQDDSDLPEPEEVDAKVREKMSAMDEAFRTVEAARALNQGTPVQSYEQEDMLPVLTEVRMLANSIGAKAVFEARAGNLDAACAWLESGLHLANTMHNCPTLIVHQVRIACLGVALGAAEEVMNTTSAPLPLEASYWTLLDRAANPDALRNMLAGEAAYAMAQRMPMPRLFWSSNESKLIDFYLELDDLSRVKSPKERRDLIGAIPVEQRFPMSPMNWMVPMLAPSLVRSIDAHDRISAQCDFVRLTAALLAWKREHGAYPDSLEALASTAPTSVDPFSGEAYHYRREGEGFLLYSVGPNRKDDGGMKVEKRDEGDIVWTCVR